MTKKIGRYELRNELGRGGMATVFQGFDPRFKRDVAVKLLPREFLHDPNFRARFEREATTIASLEHSAIVPVYDFGEEDGQPFLVMRFMPGGSLEDRLDRGRSSVEETAKVLSRLASALDFAHENGVIHRDLKPANVLFDKRGDAYLADFGIVKLTEETATLTGTGGIIGTPAYMSPEQARGKGGIDQRSDLYSLGVIIFQMLTGSQPFEADTPIGLAVMHINEPTPDILEVSPDLPPAVGKFIQQAMAKEKAQRFDTAQDLADAFETSTFETVDAPAIEQTVADLEPTLVEDEFEEPVSAPPSSMPKERAPARRDPRPGGLKLLPILGIGGIIVVIGGIALFAIGGGPDLLTTAPEPSTSPTATFTSLPTLTKTARPQPTSTVTLSPTPAFDPSAMVEIARPLDIPNDVNSVAWSPDGSMLAALERIFTPWPEHQNGNLYVWDTANYGAPIAKKIVNNSFPEMVRWSSDSSLLATSGAGAVFQIWDTNSWAVFSEINITSVTGRTISVTSAVVWSPTTATLLATGSNDGRINIWDVESSELQAEICCPLFSRNSGNMAWSNNGASVAASAGGFQTPAVTVWEAETGIMLQEIPGRSGSLDFSPNRNQLLMLGPGEVAQTSQLRIWDVANRNEVLSWEIDQYAAVARWSPDGDIIAVAVNRDKIIELRDSSSGALIHSIEYDDPVPEVSGFTDMSWSPDGTKLAVANLDGTVRVFGIPDN